MTCGPKWSRGAPRRLVFPAGGAQRRFTVPGTAADFDSVFELLAAAGYTGWLLVEQSRSRPGGSAEYAIMARKFIREHTGL